MCFVDNLNVSVKLKRASSNHVPYFCVTIFDRITQVRTSVYNPHFLEPILDKKELAQPLQDNDVRRFRPIKAAKTEQVSSIFYDPLMQ